MKYFASFMKYFLLTIVIVNMFAIAYLLNVVNIGEMLASILSHISFIICLIIWNDIANDEWDEWY